MNITNNINKLESDGIVLNSIIKSRSLRENTAKEKRALYRLFLTVKLVYHKHLKQTGSQSNPELGVADLTYWSKKMNLSIGNVITDTEAKFFRGCGEVGKDEIWHALSEKNQCDLFKNSDYFGKCMIIKDTEHNSAYQEIFRYSTDASEKALSNIWDMRVAKECLFNLNSDELSTTWWTADLKRRQSLLEALYPEADVKYQGSKYSFADIAAMDQENIDMLPEYLVNECPYLLALKLKYRENLQF